MESLGASGTNIWFVGPSGIHYWIAYAREDGFAVTGEVRKLFYKHEVQWSLERLIEPVTSMASFA